MNEWNPIDEVSTVDLKDIIACDTRDFSIFTTDGTVPVDFYNLKYDDSSVFNKNDILSFLKGIRQSLISTNNYYHGINVLKFNIPDGVDHYKGWLKYIRFMKIGDNKYIMYTMSRDNIYLLSVKFINAGNIKLKVY